LYKILQKMLKIHLLSAFILLAYTANSQEIKSNLNKHTDEIVILHTNDIHAQIDNFARLAFVLDSIRKIYKNVYLLNAGDIFTGNPMVDMSPEKGFAVIDLMNRMNYHVSAFGNHEFDYGQEVLAKRINEAKFPFICANLINENSRLKTPKPFIKFKSNNQIDICILSVLDNSANGLPETLPSRLTGLKFSDPIVTAQKYSKLARKSDLFIALTHIGIENDTILAGKMPEIDLIVGGHSHTNIDSIMMVNGVMIAQTNGRLRNLGEIKIKIDNGQIIEKSYKLINLRSKVNVNNEIKELTQQYSQNEILKEVLAKAKVKLSGNEEIGSFYTDALRNTFHFDMAFQNSGGIRINEIPEGDITMETIYRMDPFGNYLMGIHLDAEEIRSLIKYSFRNGRIDLRVSGIQYTIVKENEAIKEIIITDDSGNLIDENKSYFVGMNDYILSTYQFSHNDNGNSMGITTAEVIIEYLKKTGEINYSGVKRTNMQDLNKVN